MDYSGFIEHRLGFRIHDTDLHDQRYINETRLHTAFDKHADNWSLEFGADFLYDEVAKDHGVDLESGDGWFDLRKLIVLWKAHPNIDVRLGRQVMTWGMGDLVFLNDLFPKDWRYWLGRDIGYIKAPSDTLKLSFYHDMANVDLIYSPRFDATRYVSGERLSFYHPMLGRRIGIDDAIEVDKPDEWFNDDELAMRIYKIIRGAELALYAFDGFYKSPGGFDPAGGKFIFPRLRTLGFSVRRPVGPGLLNLETAYWYAKDDPDGDNPFIDNGHTRLLAGYEWEAAKNFTVGLQYYAEHMHNYDNYSENMINRATSLGKVHDLFSIRLTKFMLSQKLKLGLFSYYTPSDGDLYLRPEINYQITDDWTVEAGGTWFDVRTDEQNAFFGQFKYNSNVYVMVRYSFAGALGD